MYTWSLSNYNNKMQRRMTRFWNRPILLSSIKFCSSMTPKLKGRLFVKNVRFCLKWGKRAGRKGNLARVSVIYRKCFVKAKPDTLTTSRTKQSCTLFWEAVTCEWASTTSLPIAIISPYSCSKATPRMLPSVPTFISL